MEQVNLQSLSNSWYNQGGNALKRVLWYLCNSLLLSSFIPGSIWRSLLLQLFGAQVGQGVVLKPRISVKYPWNLKIGNHSWIGERVWIDNLALVSIGNNCCVSQAATFTCGNHNYKKSSFDLIVNPITMHDCSWVCAFTHLSPGCILQQNAVLGIGSTAIGELKANGIYQGTPAVLIKNRDIIV